MRHHGFRDMENIDSVSSEPESQTQNGAYKTVSGSMARERAEIGD